MADQEYEVDDAALQAQLRELAAEIDARTDPEMGFCLLLFRFDGAGMFYISNAERPSMLKAIQEFVRVQKARGH